MRYESRKLVSDDGPSGARPTENPIWRNIRNLSVIGFVDKVSGILGAANDPDLRRALANSALCDGEPVRYRGITYTVAMQLEMYQRREDPGLHQTVSSKREWDLFCDALRKLRDPSIPMLAREPLLRIGEAMYERELSHAKEMGWAR